MTARQLVKAGSGDSVTRDGARRGRSAYRYYQGRAPGAADTVEVLIPDFRGQEDALLQVMEAGPEVVNHNVETVPRLYRTVRPQAIYSRSIELLARVHNYGKGLLAKSGLMLGLGETVDEVVQVMEDLREAGCDIVTLGQPESFCSPSSGNRVYPSGYLPDAGGYRV